jgi:hypothetical protein
VWGARLLCLVVLLVSANNVVLSIGKESVYLVTAGLLALYAVFRRARVTRRDLAVAGVFAGVSLAHCLMFGEVALKPSLGFAVRVAIALLVVRCVPMFHRTFVGLMVVLSAVSFLFYVPVLLGVDLRSVVEQFRIPLEGSDILHIGVHNFHLVEEARRNSGMFGEPGMFAGYIAVAMVFGARDLSRSGRWSWRILTAAMITTQSTTGYVALVPLFVMRIVARMKAEPERTRYVALIGGALVAVSAFAVMYTTVPFLGAKIEQQLDEAFQRTDTSRISRFGNLLYDLESIKERPGLGWSPVHSTRALLDSEVEELVNGQGNGLSGFAVKFGLIGLATFLLAAMGAMKQLHDERHFAFLGVAVIATVLIGEQFLNAPMFLALMFSPALRWREQQVPPVPRRGATRAYAGQPKPAAIRAPGGWLARVPGRR